MTRETLFYVPLSANRQAISEAVTKRTYQFISKPYIGLPLKVVRNLFDIVV